MPAQALDLYRGSVQPQWIDYNGHMNLAYYVLAFDKATDLLFDKLELGRDYVRSENCSVFVAETHVVYERELRLGEPIRISSQLIDADAKRLHFFHSMYHGDTGFRAATIEILALHVMLEGPRSAAIPPQQQRLVADLLAEHATLPRPQQLGRVIGIRRS